MTFTRWQHTRAQLVSCTIINQPSSHIQLEHTNICILKQCRSELSSSEVSNSGKRNQERCFCNPCWDQAHGLSSALSTIVFTNLSKKQYVLTNKSKDNSPCSAFIIIHHLRAPFTHWHRRRQVRVLTRHRNSLIPLNHRPRSHHWNGQHVTNKY